VGRVMQAATNRSVLVRVCDRRRQGCGPVEEDDVSGIKRARLDQLIQDPGFPRVIPSSLHHEHKSSLKSAGGIDSLGVSMQ
jgi:hypothetical protein